MYETFVRPNPIDAVVDEEMSMSDEDIEKSSSWLKSLKVLLPSTAIVTASTLFIFVGSILYSTSSRNNISSSVTITTKQVSTLTSDVVSNGNTPSQYFMLKKVGYDNIDYFDTTIDTVLKYDFLSSYISIVEPSSDMEFKLYDAYKSSLNTFQFEVCPQNGRNGGIIESECQIASRSYNFTTLKASSSHVNFNCDPFDQFTITVKEISYVDGTTVLSTLEGSVICMYIRRELRSLSSSDLTAVVETMHKLWTTSETEGVARYGENFHNITYLLRFHHFNAADRKTDHIHNGNGILMQHVKFTNIFEKSIQSINPSLSLPYWDFTIDTAEGKFANESFALSPSIFGHMHKPKSFEDGFSYEGDSIVHGAIPDGLWKNYKSDFNVFADMDYAYGYMRGPWNLNPNPYVSRYTFNFSMYKMPSCSDHFSLMQYDDLMTFFNLGEFAPHGNVHILTGGAYGCDMFQPLLDKGFIGDEYSLHKLCISWSAVIMKSAYRYHLLTPQKDCVVNSVDVNLSECKYECKESDKDALYEFISSLAAAPDDPGYLNLNLDKPGSKEAWLEFICGGNGGKVFSGDNFESASPIDPIFWLIHPPLERLLHAKFMGGGFLDESWGTDAVKQNVCVTAKCYSDEEGRAEYFDDCCYGHFENDRLLDAVSGDRTQYFGPSNAQTLAATDPRSSRYAMPYVYDDFSWDHCTEQDFAGLLYQSYQKKMKNV